MKRQLTAVAAGLALALVSAGNALADGSSPVPPPAPGSQSNDSSQGQVQVIPIAPQLDVQNVNVLTGDVEQGDAANANTGQTAQQQNSAVGQSQAGPQSNDSAQGQVQIVPIAPQANVQNVNVATFGDVEQGDAANSNTGQTAQQENTAAGSHHGPSSTSIGESHAGAQENTSHQGQVQVIPVAPQLNVQNVNVATFGDVEQGDAANANTGQTAQQENTAEGTTGGSPSDQRCGGCSPAQHSGGQSNRSAQKQVQVVPIAPQANVQNVNVLTFGDVEQGDAANANTGQTAQQENTRVSSHGKQEPKHCDGACKPQHAKPCPSTCEPNGSKHSSYGHAGGGQRNVSHQGQVQIVPIAPQANLQNVDVLTFGDVEQGDAANANTGQSTQQENTRVSGACGKHEPEHCFDACKPRTEPKPTPCGSYEKYEPRPEPKPRPCDSYGEHRSHGEHGSYDRCEPRPEPRPRPCSSYGKHGSYSEHGSYGKCEPEPKPKPNCQQPPKHGGGQSSESYQGQVQILSIAPQLDVQNVNLLTFGDVEQGDAANANTGQAAQQSNRLLPARPSVQRPTVV